MIWDFDIEFTIAAQKAACANSCEVKMNKNYYVSFHDLGFFYRETVGPK